MSPAVMPTVQVKVTRGRNKYPIRSLIDTGSQKSFISAELAKKLQLPVVNTVRLSITTFGGEGVIKEFDAIRLKVQLGYYRFVCRLIVHDKVNTPINCPGVLQMHKLLRKSGVTLAD